MRWGVEDSQERVCFQQVITLGSWGSILLENSGGLSRTHDTELSPHKGEGPGCLSTTPSVTG